MERIGSSCSHLNNSSDSNPNPKDNQNEEKSEGSQKQQQQQRNFHLNLGSLEPSNIAPIQFNDQNNEFDATLRKTFDRKSNLLTPPAPLYLSLSGGSNGNLYVGGGAVISPSSMFLSNGNGNGNGNFNYKQSPMTINTLVSAGTRSGSATSETYENELNQFEYSFASEQQNQPQQQRRQVWEPANSDSLNAIYSNNNGNNNGNNGSLLMSNREQHQQQQQQQQQLQNFSYPSKRLKSNEESGSNIGDLAFLNMISNPLSTVSFSDRNLTYNLPFQPMGADSGNNSVLNTPMPIVMTIPANNSISADSTAADSDRKKQISLERNRQAAVKCRRKKKEDLERLESIVQQMEMTNALLQRDISAYREEILRIRTLILTHRNCPNRRQ